MESGFRPHTALKSLPFLMNKSSIPSAKGLPQPPSWYLPISSSCLLPLPLPKPRKWQHPTLQTEHKAQQTWWAKNILFTISSSITDVSSTKVETLRRDRRSSIHLNRKMNPYTGLRKARNRAKPAKWGKATSIPFFSSPFSPALCYHSGALPVIPALPWFLPNTAQSGPEP